MKQLFSISLALIILASQLGLSLTTHYCGNTIVERQLMLGQHSLDCGMSKLDENCSDEYNGCSIESGNCCENHFISIELEDYHNKVIREISFDTEIQLVYFPDFLETFNISFENKIETNFPIYSPPLLTQNNQILYQTFLL